MTPTPSQFFDVTNSIYQLWFHLGNGISARHAPTSHPEWGGGDLVLGEIKELRFGGRWGLSGKYLVNCKSRRRTNKPDCPKYYSPEFELFKRDSRDGLACYYIYGEAGQSGSKSEDSNYRTFLASNWQTGHTWMWDGKRNYEDTYDIRSHKQGIIEQSAIVSFTNIRGPFAITRDKPASKFESIIGSPLIEDIMPGLLSMREQLTLLFPGIIQKNSQIFALISQQGWGLHVDSDGTAQQPSNVWDCPNMEVYVSLLIGNVAFPRVGWQKWYSNQFDGEFILERENWSWHIIRESDPSNLILPERGVLYPL